MPQPLAPLPPLGAADPGGPALPIDVAYMFRAQSALGQVAGQHMVKMKPDGDAFAGQFNNGQVLEQAFEIEPGRCYGAVAVGVGISELEMALVLGEPPVDHVMGRDELKGWQAVIGPSGRCISNPLPATAEAKLVITAVTGQGQVLARIYSK